MFKKIATIAILLGLFLAASLIADEESTYYYSGTVYINGTAATLKIGYIPYYGGPEYDVITAHAVSGSYPYGFHTYAAPAWKIYVKGWTSQGYYDYDECYAHLGGGNNLHLDLNVVLPDPQLPHE